jgi:hypothetical protein
VLGRTPLEPEVWYHAAASYDGSTWRLYLDGALDGERTVDATPRSDSIQHFGLGAAFDSTGTPAGAFGGELDEVRVWDRARTAAEIADGLGREIDAADGLVARWALDETAGATAADARDANPGTVSGAVWVAGGAPFALVGPPSISLIAPADGAEIPAAAVDLSVWVDARGGLPLEVELWGRPVDPDFAVVALPDTQYYSQDYPETFGDQTRWVRSHAAEYNIRAVLHEGDVTDNGDDEAQWRNANAAMTELELPQPGLPDGVPFGIAVGNHDQIGTTVLFNTTFGVGRFSGRSYYGGHYGTDYDNHYIVFDAGTTPYLALFLEYDEAADPAVLAWAHGVLDDHPEHRVLVTQHSMIGPGDPGAWTAQGQATYEALRDVTRIDLLLCGHIGGEGRRTDEFGGHAIHTLLADYQFLSDGAAGYYGDGWLRLLQFSPAQGTIHVRTWSVVFDRWQTDADSDFILTYDSPAGPFERIATRSGVTPGSAVVASWAGREPGRTYQWYAEADNCAYQRPSDSWTFRTR